MSHFKIALQLFADAGSAVVGTAGTVNAGTGAVTPTNDMSAEMKTYYNTVALKNARRDRVYLQLAKHEQLPKNHGRTIEWRKPNTLPNLKKLTEGVIPRGQSFGYSSCVATVAQYGDYTAVTDALDTHAIDPVILDLTSEYGAAAGNTQEDLTRDALLSECNNVLFADAINPANDAYVSTPSTLYGLLNGVSAACRFTPDVCAKARTKMRKDGVPKIDNAYVAVVHPSVVYDLRNCKGWEDVIKYADPKRILDGEVGKLNGIRFVENEHAPVMVGAPLYNDATRYLTVSAYASNATAGTAIATGFGTTSAYRITVSETLASATADYEKLIGRHILIEASGAIADRCEVVGVDVTNKYIYVKAAPVTAPASGNFLLPGDGGAESKAANVPVAIYGTMIFGENAFATVDPEGAGLEVIVKTRDQIGGPLNQFSTVGAKLEAATKILYPDRILTVWSTSSYSGSDEANCAI